MASVVELFHCDKCGRVGERGDLERSRCYPSPDHYAQRVERGPVTSSQGLNFREIRLELHGLGRAERIPFREIPADASDEVARCRRSILDIAVAAAVPEGASIRDYVAGLRKVNDGVAQTGLQVADARAALGARMGEGLIDAAKRVAQERDQARADRDALTSQRDDAVRRGETTAKALDAATPILCRALRADAVEFTGETWRPIRMAPGGLEPGVIVRAATSSPDLKALAPGVVCRLPDETAKLPGASPAPSLPKPRNACEACGTAPAVHYSALARKRLCAACLKANVTAAGEALDLTTPEEPKPARRGVLSYWLLHRSGLCALPGSGRYGDPARRPWRRRLAYGLAAATALAGAAAAAIQSGAFDALIPK